MNALARATLTVAFVAASTAVAAGADRAYWLTDAAWSCETWKNNGILTKFTAAKNRFTGVDLLLPAASGSPQVTESFAFDPRAHRWRAVVAGGVFSGVAGEWLGAGWTFEGSTVIKSTRSPGRMIFTYLDDNAFRRDFEVETDRRWRIYSVETCSRGVRP